MKFPCISLLELIVLEMIDVDVEASAASLVDWIGELGVGFAEDAVLGIFERCPICCSLSAFSA